ncbi:minor tail protein [Mycobacterium phage ThetaBob]|uniref:Minor tail protein n=2 Tax=Gracegardnervirinae TaxID=2946632 RepID=A0A4Y6EMH2_9CAUD|nr:minor tail protein [Mycobacterium phage ThetaBob]YP_009856205.1 minor tail protein [Mycobacterium phage Cornie]QDF19906.1 minor tail protein [Mycobacterium phage ThetaBob]QIG58396.1 minor tail protein [Mycobacterium phage Cornie]
MSWPTTPDGNYYRFEGLIDIPVDPETGAAILYLRPQGGMGVGIPAIANGEPGKHAELDETINLTVIEDGDPTQPSASFTTLVPPTTDTPGKWRLNLALPKGAKGDDGEAVWDPTDVAENPVAGQIPVVNDTADGFNLEAQKITEVFFPASINNTASGNANSTLAVVEIPARPYARRVRPVGYTVVTGEGADVRVDLVARLNGESGGNVVGRCPGIAQTERLTLIPGKPTGSAGPYDTIAAGDTALVYIRCERQAGSVTYTTSASSSNFSVEVTPA